MTPTTFRYIRRRAKEGFHETRLTADPAAAETLLQSGRQELEVVKRQSLVYQLFGRKVKNVLVRVFMLSHLLDGLALSPISPMGVASCRSWIWISS
jgi:hypothetical protein